MKIFISYGHPEEELARRIRAALEARGHEPWFDRNEVRHDQNWRDAVVRGIETSDAVVACLSRHAVRDPGACLDELAIAFGVRGGNIQTLLLEPEEQVEPPASVCHLQPLDLSDWRARLAAGEDAFALWFNRKMARLFEVLERPECRYFSGEITDIRNRLSVNYDTGRQRELLRQPFVGRAWLTAEVEAWLDDPHGGRLCVLTGDAGVGKSAFAANFIHRNPRVAAGLFCRHDMPLYRDASTVAMTLAYLLACRLPHYRALLRGVLERERRLGEMNARELFSRLLTEPLSLTNLWRGTLCVVIDGLDECGDAEGNELARTLAGFAEALPAWLRVLVLARDIASVRAPLAGAFRLPLAGSRPENRADIREFFRRTLGERFGGHPAFPEALDTLTERSGGVFLYAKLVADGLVRGRASIDEPDAFPEGLSAAFDRWFQWFFPDGQAYKRDFRLPLGVLLAAPEPLPVEELTRVFDWDENEANDFLRRVEALLARGEDDFGRETAALSHRYIETWLTSPDAAGYRTSRSAAQKRLAERFLALSREDIEALTPFEALHLTALLDAAGKRREAEALRMERDLLWRLIDAGDDRETWGKLSAALRCYAEARDMAEKMTRERSEPKDRRALSVSYERVGDILKAQGELPDALALYRKSLAIAERLAEELGTPQSQRDLSVSYNKVGDILKAQGKLPDALALYRKGLAIAERLAEELGTPQSQRDLWVSSCKLGDILQARGELLDALALYRKGLAIAERLAEELGTPQSQRDLSVSYERVGGILQARGELPDALALYRKSLAIAERLAEELGTPESRRDLSVSYAKIGGIFLAQDKLSDALAQFRGGLAIAERLAEEMGTPQSTDDLRYFQYIIAQLQ